MRKFLVFPALALLALLAPAAAQAHHVDWNISTAQCALVNNAPVVSIKVSYRAFEDFNKPVRWELKFDGVLKGSGLYTWAGPDADQRISRAAHAGNVVVDYHSSWGDEFSGGSASKRWTVLCPTPVPPPPPPVIIGCNGSVVPIGTPMPTCVTTVLVCNGTTMLPGTTTCPPPPVVKTIQVRKVTRCVHRRDIVFHTVKGSGTRLGVVSLFVNHVKVRTRDGHFLLKSIRFHSVPLRHPGHDGRVPIRIIANLRKADGSALQFRVRDRVKPCGATIRRDP